MKQMKSLSCFLILVLSIHISYCTISSNKIKSGNNAQVNSLKSNLNSKISGKFLFKTKIQNKDLEMKQINLDPYSGQTSIWKGWAKYYHMQTSTKFDQPTNFLVNNSFFNQKVLKSQFSSTGPVNNEDNSPINNIKKYIPTKFHFFINLNSHFLEINTNRFDPLTSKIESLNLDLVDPILNDDLQNTGLKVIEKSEEGNCVDLSVHSLSSFTDTFMPTAGDYSSSNPEHWLICLEDDKEFKTFIGVLTAILNAKESARNRPKITGAASVAADITEEHYTGPGANPAIDGYLVRINNWTQCTLKCGGGLSYQQWKCVPPKEGGKPCKGDLIRQNKCNTQACPSVGNADGTSTESNIKVEAVLNDPIIKSQPISNRPQQNVDCLVREEDVLQNYNDPILGNVSYPGRLILNSNLITLFSDVEEKKSVFSFDIKSASLVPVDQENCCFYMELETKKYKICGMANCNTFVNSWARSYDLFSQKCYSTLLSQPANIALQPTTQSSSSSVGFSQNMEIDEDTASVKNQVISASINQTAAANAASNVNTTQTQALKVINREIDIEEMIKKEEMIKSQDKVKKKLEEMKHEEKKKEKLDQALQSQQEQQSLTVAQLKADQTTQAIQTDTEQDILDRRNTLKLRIKKIRQQAERRTKLIQNKINVIRNKMTTQILQATKTGNAQTCHDAWGNQDLMDSYCDANSIDDIVKNESCKINDNFCFSCCDYEFGLASQGKESCYNICLSKENIRGDWLKNSS